MRPSLLLPAIALMGVSGPVLAQTITYYTSVIPSSGAVYDGQVNLELAPSATISVTPPGCDVSIGTVQVNNDPTAPSAVSIPFTVILTIERSDNRVPYTKQLNAMLEGRMAPGQAEVRVRWVTEMPVVFGPAEAPYSVWPVPSSSPMPFKDDPLIPGLQPDPLAPRGVLSVHITAGGTAFPAVTGLTVLPSAVGVGAYSMVTIQTSAPAPIDGLVVDIGSSDQAMVGTPGTIRIPAGATAATFPVAGRHVSMASVTASAMGSSKTTSLRVSPTLPCGVKGDMNGDGTLTVEDAIAMLKVLAGL